MNIQETVLNILEDITGTDEVVNNQDIQLFEEGLLDSLATVQLLVEIEGQLGIQVPVSDFDREVWGTPKQIIQQVEAFTIMSRKTTNQNLRSSALFSGLGCSVLLHRSESI